MSSEQMTYATLDLDGRQVGGIGDMGAQFPAEVPAHWNLYFAVTDTGATVARAVELGGSVTVPAADTPFGRMAGLADDQGAPFSVIQLSPAQAARG
jgi:predicted enzyme related to lactoylglutathione lyase